MWGVGGVKPGGGGVRRSDYEKNTSSVLVRRRVCFKPLRRGIFGGPKRQECTFNGREALWVYFKANLFTLYFFFGRFFYKRSLWSLLGFFAHQPPLSKHPPTTHHRWLSRGGFV